MYVGLFKVIIVGFIEEANHVVMKWNPGGDFAFGGSSAERTPLPLHYRDVSA